jgi:hypothetical protein
MAYGRFNNPLGSYKGVQFILPTNTPQGLSQGSGLGSLSTGAWVAIAAAAAGVWYFFLRKK